MIPPSANLELLRSTFHILESTWNQVMVSVFGSGVGSNQKKIPFQGSFLMKRLMKRKAEIEESSSIRAGFLKFSEPLFGFINHSAITTSPDMMPNKGDLPRITQGFSARHRKIEGLTCGPGEVCHIYVSGPVCNIAVPLRLHLKYGVRSSLLQM